MFGLFFIGMPVLYARVPSPFVTTYSVAPSIVHIIFSTSYMLMS